MHNNFDSIHLDFEAIEQKLALQTRPKSKSRLSRLISKYFVGGLLWFGVYKKLVDAGFIRGWLDEFEVFWSQVLEGRPLYFHDFHYLLGVYRQKFQVVETPEIDDPEGFLESWTSDNSVYQLFGAVRRYGQMPLDGIRIEPFVKEGGTVLEFGSGIAPFSYYLVNYCYKKPSQIHFADIPQLNWYYARSRLPEEVEAIKLDLLNNKLNACQYDLVVMMAVMEHLPRPLDTVMDIWAALRPGGFLCLDYILGDGDGQDTIAAVAQRSEIISFFSEKFVVVKGEISIQQSMGFTVLKKV